MSAGHAAGAGVIGGGLRVLPKASLEAQYLHAARNRVPVEHGHTACMSVAFERAPSPDEAMAATRPHHGRG